jgi:hypothetical protein
MGILETVATILLLIGIAWWGMRQRRRRARSRPPITMDEQRRQLLRSIAASDYTPKRQDRQAP